MTSARRFWSVTIVVSILFIASAVEARAVPGVEIRLADAAAARALDPIEFTAIISLPHSDAAAGPAAAGNVMAITGLSIEPTGMLANDYAGAAKCQFQQQGLRADQSIEVPCMLYPARNGIKEKLLPSLGAVFAKSMLLQTRVFYMKNDESSEGLGVTRVAVLPPLVAVFYGGMMGALLLAVFRGLAPFRHGFATAPPAFPQTSREFFTRTSQGFLSVCRALIVAFSWLVLGGISAIMIIILTKASAGAVSPVQIEVKDFVGGVLVGLLSFPVVDWLEKRLVASEVAKKAMPVESGLA